MTEHRQHLVDPGAPESEAVARVEAARRWLARVGLITLETSDDPRALGEHPPGPSAQAWTCPGAFAVEEERGRWTNGVDLRAGRSVYCGDASGAAACPACGAELEFGATDPDWLAALSDWEAGWGEGAFGCPGCGAQTSAVDWRCAPVWGFGAVALCFWNWPPLSRALTDAVEAALFDGRRSVYVAEAGLIDPAGRALTMAGPPGAR